MFNVLIVDDDTNILEGLHHIVDWVSLGLQIVATASSGTEAIECLKKHTIHILLTDIKMPDMDGITLIKWVREHSLPIKCIVLSGYNDYEYMKQVLTLDIENYLIKSINEDELLETLENTVKKLECKNDLVSSPNNILLQNILLRWMNGKITRLELRERISFLGLNIPMENLCVCHLRFNSKAAKKYTPDTLSSSMTCLQESLTSSSPVYPIYWVQDFNEDYCFLFSGETPEQLKELTSLMAKSISNTFTDTFFLTIGKNSVGFTGCFDSYQSAKYLMDYSLMLTYGTIISYDEFAAVPTHFDTAYTRTLESLRHTLIEGNKDQALNLVDALYHRDFQLNHYAPDYLKNISLKIFFLLMDAISDLDLNSADIHMSIDLVYDKVSSSTSGDTLYDWIKKLVADFFSLKKNREIVDNPMFQRIITYVSRHYAEDISLKTLSYEFNINTAYLGRVFKDAAGETFSNYLNRIRVEKAKYMLNQSNSTVQEISTKIGYNSTNYFVNVFKKYTGCFPSQFRSRRNV